MGRPRHDLGRRGRVILWAGRHPLLAHGLTVAAGLGYLYALLGVAVGLA